MNKRTRVLKGPLNPRQREILKWVAAGLTHEATAQELHVTRVCVSENMRIIVAKLGTNNTAEAIGRWTESNALRGAAALLEGNRVQRPLDAVEEHVNHVLDELAQLLRQRADKLIPPL